MKKSYIKYIILINLIALAVFLLTCVPAADDKQEIRALDMQLINYKKDFYTGRELAKVQGGVGSAIHKFHGPAGIYNILVEYIDEDDGNASYQLKINNVIQAEWTADRNPTKDSSFIYTADRLVLQPNDDIEVEGTRNEGESARLVGMRIDFVESASIMSFVTFSALNTLQFMAGDGLKQTFIYVSSQVILNLLVWWICKYKEAISARITKFRHNQPDNADHALGEQSLIFDAGEEISENPEQGVPSSSPPFNNDDNALLRDILAFIEANYTDKNFSLQQMSDHFGMSPNHLSMYFKKHTGQNIIFYLTNLRLEKAKHYLESTDMPLQAVAHKSGYYNISSFIRRFKAEIGVTPGDYRKLSSPRIRREATYIHLFSKAYNKIVGMKSYLKGFVLLNLLAFAVYLMISLPPLHYREEIKAVDMELNNYTRDYYTEQYVVKVAGSLGSVRHQFNGPPGIYDISVEYIDETDGESDYTLKINDAAKEKWTENRNPSKDRSFIHTAERIVLLTGDIVEIEGTRNRYSSARLAGMTIDFRTSVSFLAYIEFAYGHMLQFMTKEGFALTSIYLFSLIILNLLLILAFKHREWIRTRIIILLRQNQAPVEQKPEDETSSPVTDESAMEDTQGAHAPLPSNNFSRDDGALLREMISFIEANCTDSDFSLQLMSDHFNISSAQLSVYFKKHTGQNMIHYLTQLRLKKARHYLTNTDLPLQAVANQSGYHNISSFIRKFKAEFGVTPGEYRKQSRQTPDGRNEVGT